MSEFLYLTQNKKLIQMVFGQRRNFIRTNFTNISELFDSVFQNDRNWRQDHRHRDTNGECPVSHR